MVTIATSFADLGPQVAAVVADDLAAFGMVGIDGSVIAGCGDGTPIDAQIDRLTAAMVALGEVCGPVHDDVRDSRHHAGLIQSHSN